MRIYLILVFIFLGVLHIIFYKKLAVFYEKKPKWVRGEHYSVKYYEFVNIVLGIFGILLGYYFLSSDYVVLSFLMYLLNLSFIVYGFASMVYPSKLTLLIDRYIHYPKTIDIKYYKIINFFIGIFFFSFGIWRLLISLHPNF